MNVSTVRTAMQTRLAAAVAGTRWYDVWPGKLNLPAGIVRRDDGPVDVTFGASPLCHLRLRVTLAVGPTADLARSQDKLDPYLATTGAQSVRAALLADSTLNGAVQRLVVGEVERDDEIDANGNQYVGAHVLVDLWGT